MMKPPLDARHVLKVCMCFLALITLPVSCAETELPPVYVTFAGHIENNSYYCDCRVYPEFRDKLIRFADHMKRAGAMVNLQIDYEFLKGTLTCETAAMRSATNGLNIIAFLSTNYDFEIDAHQEGAWDWSGPDNYADVRYTGELLTSDISNTVGGFVWDYALQFPELARGQRGRLHPQFTWYPEILTCAVGYKHHLGDFSGDDFSSGVWIPAGVNENFRVHDPEGPMVYIGSGPHGNWGSRPDCTFRNSADYVNLLVYYLHTGKVSPAMFTATIALPQDIMFNQPEEAVKIVEQLNPLVAEGKVKYVHYTQVVEIWQSDFGSRPNIFTFDQIDPSDYTCN